MKDVAMKLADFLVKYDGPFNPPKVNDLPFQIVLSNEIQLSIWKAVLESRKSGKEYAAKLIFSNTKDAEDLVDWASGKKHSISISTTITGLDYYRGTFHTHPPETELEVFKGMGYPPSAGDINTLVNVKKNLVCIVAADDQKAKNPELYLLVKTESSKATVDDDALVKQVTMKVKGALEKKKVEGSAYYDLCSRTYNSVVEDLCTKAFVGYYWGYLTKDCKGAIILQNLAGI